MALQRELQRGERVLWKGRQLARFKLAPFAMWTFAIPWTAFSLFWTFMAWSSVDGTSSGFGGAGLIAYAFPLFGLPFVAVGCAMLSAPFITVFTARKTLFAITDQRLIRLYVGRKLRSKTAPAHHIGAMERSEKPDGSGSLRIALGEGEAAQNINKAQLFILGDVENIRLAENHIRELVQRNRRISSSASTRS